MSSLEGFEIPVVKLIKYQSLTQFGSITDDKKHENIFRLKGTLSIQVYLSVNEKTTVKELADSLIRDIEVQF